MFFLFPPPFTSAGVSGEDPETVEMGDVEILHPGAVGEQLLREAGPGARRAAGVLGEIMFHWG